MVRRIKRWLLSHEKIYIFAVKILNFFGGNSRIRSKHPSVLLKHTKVIDKGSGNTVIINKKSILKNCCFKFYGSNNCVTIGENCILSNLTVWFEDENNSVKIGNNTTIHGTTGLACIEGSRIDIGEDCMFSSNIGFRTGDSHSVLDLEGNRINPSKNISIGNHVWIGNGCYIGKGAAVADNSIVGAHSVVTKKFDKSNIAIGGNPAKVIKENVNWCRERL